jgi:hypothetical protein
MWYIWKNKSRISAEEWNSFATLSPWKYASTTTPSIGRLSAYAVAHTIRLDEGGDVVPPEILAWLKNADPPSTVRKIGCLTNGLRPQKPSSQKEPSLVFQLIDPDRQVPIHEEEKSIQAGEMVKQKRRIESRAG